MKPSDNRRETFENLYRRDPDPWKTRTSDYEQAKFAATLEVLGVFAR